MATKRGSKPRRAPAKGKKAARKSRTANGRHKGDIVLGPIITKEVRVPINLKEYKAKESEIAQLEVKIKKAQRKIAPDLKAIRDTRKEIGKLTEDVENNTELRPMKVKLEYHYKTSEVRVLRAEDQKEIERRTMTADEVNRNADVEDKKLDKPIDAGMVETEQDDDSVIEDDGDPGATAGEEVVQ